MEAVRVDITQQEASYHKLHEQEIPWKYDHDPNQEYELDFDSYLQGKHSKPCNICLQENNRKEKATLYTRLRKYITSKSDLEEKLRRLNIQCEKSRNPLHVFSRFIIRLVWAEEEDKFTTDELHKLSLSQLMQLKYSLAGAVSVKTSELHQEEETRFRESQELDLKKEEARVLEQRAWSTLRPFVNLHPSLDDLTRVLMS